MIELRSDVLRWVAERTKTILTSTGRQMPILAAGGILVVMLSACSGTPANVRVASAAPPAINRNEAVALMTPAVRYKTVNSENSTQRSPENNAPAPRVSEQDIAEWLSGTAREELSMRGLRVVGEQNTGEPSASAQCVRSNAALRELEPILRPACAKEGVRAVLCQEIKVDIGDEAGWKVWFTGVGIAAAPRPGSSSVLLRSVIRECATAKEIWRGQVLHRSLPDLVDASFINAVKSVYQGIVIEEGM